MYGNNIINLIIFLLICLLLAFWANQTDIKNGVKIGDVYKHENKNPFDKEITFYKVLDVKGRYVKYTAYYIDNGEIISYINSKHKSLIYNNKKSTEKELQEFLIETKI